MKTKPDIANKVMDDIVLRELKSSYFRLCRMEETHPNPTVTKEIDTLEAEIRRRQEEVSRAV